MPDDANGDRAVIVLRDAGMSRARGTEDARGQAPGMADTNAQTRETEAGDAGSAAASDAGLSDSGEASALTSELHALADAGGQPVIVLPNDGADASPAPQDGGADAATRPDAGNAPDAATSPEAGRPVDAATTQDAGSAPDAGSVPPERSAHLVINELDYDQVGVDGAEFVEIYNPGPRASSLANVALVLVNGATSSEYARVALGAAGELAPGAFLVIAGTEVVVAPGAAVLRFELASNNIQNGPADAVGLLDTSAGVLIDALSYEGSVTNASLVDVSAGLSLVEGTPLPDTKESADDTSAGSLIRLPDGADTDDAAADFRFTTTPTPGAPNRP